MTDTEPKAFEPVDLSPELERQSRIEELKYMREHESMFAYPARMEEVKDVCAEMSVRLMQYKTLPYSETFKIFQTLQDFNRYISPLQTRDKFNETKPLAFVKETKEQIYLDGTMFVIR